MTRLSLLVKEVKSKESNFRLQSQEIEKEKKMEEHTAHALSLETKLIDKEQEVIAAKEDYENGT